MVPRLPAGVSGSLFGAIAGLILLVILLAFFRHGGEREPGRDDRPMMPALGGTLERRTEQAPLGDRADAVKDLALTQLKFEGIDRMLESIGLITLDKERGIVLRQCIEVSSRKAEGEAAVPGLSTISAIVRIIETLPDPKDKCLCYSRLIELRKLVKNEDEEPTLKALVDKAKSAAGSIPDASRDRAGPFYVWGALFVIAGFVVTNLIAAMLSEVSKHVVQSLIRTASPEPEKRTDAGSHK